MTIVQPSSPILKAFIDISSYKPNLLAIKSEKKAVTYGELIILANSLAHELQLKIKVSGQVVAIIGEKEIETPIAIIACLLAGIPFVVIDNTYPESRIASVCKIAGAVALLHCKSNQLIRSEIVQHLFEVEIFIKIDDPHPIRTQQPIPYVCEIAYLLFTSGTTGFPKGIKTGHSPLPHFIEWYKQKFNPTQGTRFSMLSGLSHDPVLRDIFVPLSVGGELHIPAQDQILVKDYLHLWMKKTKIQYAHMTPQLIKVLLISEQKDLPLTDLHYVFSGGDVLRPTIFPALKQVANNVKLVNFYGTSETPQAMAYQVIDEDTPAPYPIGREINDVKIEILDDDLNPLKATVVGEISIETKYLSLGYINNSLDEPTSTRQNSFVTNDSNNENDARKYLTGDIGFKDEQGNIHFRGRKDDQVKIRGYRVNCSEVAATIERHGLAKQAVVIPESENNEDTYLTAFTTSKSENINQGIREVMPSYMVPNYIVGVSSIPLLPNGKVDRNALKLIGVQHKADLTNKISHFDNELLIKIAKDLKHTNINPKLSFVKMGGDSLSYINISLLIENYVGFLPNDWENIPLDELCLMKVQSEKTSNNGIAEKLFSKVPHSILLRAISIIFVVLNHAGMFFISGTSTLFVIAGMGFARFQLHEVINNRTLIPTFRFIAKYAIPASLWQLMRSYFVTDYIWFPDLIMTGTFWQKSNGGHYTFWFLDVLTASILIFCMLALIISSSKYVARRIFKKIEPYFGISLAVLLLGVLAYIVQTKTNGWNGTLGNTSVGPFRWFWMIPFGSAIHFAKSNAQKSLISAIGASIILIFMLFTPVNLSSESKLSFDYFFIASVLVLIWLEQLYIPKILYTTIVIIASNSLFIYIVNHAVLTILMPKLAHSLGFHNWILLNVLAAITFGVLTGIFWNRISYFFKQIKPSV